MKRQISLLILLLLFQSILAQTEKIDDLLKEAKSAETEAALELLSQSLKLSEKESYLAGIFLSIDGLTSLNEKKGSFVEAGKLYKKGLNYAKDFGDKEQEAIYHGNLAIIHYYLGDWEASVAGFKEALKLNEKLGRKEKVADGYANLANLFQMEGKHVESVDYYLEAIRIFEEIGLQNGIGTTLFNLANLYHQREEDSTAYTYFDQAEQIFRTEKDSASLARSLSSKSVSYFNWQEYDQAEKLLGEALIISQNIGDAQAHMHILYKLGTLYNYQGKTAKAEMSLRKAFEMAEMQQSNQHICWIKTELALAEKAKGNYAKGLQLLDEAMSVAREIGMAEYFHEISKIKSELLEKLPDYRAALDTYKDYASQKDSLLTEKKNSRIAELQTVYETEKKDKEIAILEKDAALSQIRIYGMSAGLVVFVFIGFLLLNQQRMKREKDREIFDQKQEIQEQKLQVAHLEREQMAQELNSQVLNFCRKNEFLQGLKSDMQSLEEQKQGREIKNLIRKIDLDLKGDQDWESFLHSFSQVHPGFTYSLTQRYEGITPNEIRLASLMRMNLSGKEIAAMLNISADGVKKARHRLRKKLGIEPEVNLQDFLLRL
ncbi:MAG: tetratricopeptide repeat protein [Bacteroidota bacterium]